MARRGLDGAERAELRLLGRVEVRLGGAEAMALPRGRRGALLAYLALAGCAVRRRALAAAFWPESFEDQSLVNLRKVLHELRRAHPALWGLLRVGSLEVALRPDVEVSTDVARFQRLAAAATAAGEAEMRAALAAYGGEFLPGERGPWVEGVRDRLAGAAREVRARLVRLLAEEQRYEEAMGAAGAALEAEPLDEGMWLDLMRLYALAGRPVEARRAFRRLEATWRRELDTDLPEGLRRAFERTQALPPAVRSPAGLVGRGEAWRALSEVWRAAQAEPAVALVRGSAGLGKTRLLTEWASWAERSDGHVRWATAYPSLAALPLGVAGIASGGAHAAGTGPTGPRVYEVLASALLARQPAALVVDDAHWADEPSLAWLAFVLRYDPSARLAVALAVRPEEEERVARALAELRRAQGRRLFREVELAPLAGEEARTLLRRVLPAKLPEAVLDDAVALAGGSPLFLTEIADHWRGAPGEGPSDALRRSARALLLRRAGEASAVERRMLDALAVLSVPAPACLLTQVSGAPEAEATRALERLVRQGTVRVDGGDRCRLFHDLLAEALRGRLPPGRRQRLSAALASGLEGLPGADPLHAAALWVDGGGRDRALALYRQVASRRSAADDRLRAIAALERAAVLSEGRERAQALCDLGELCQDAGDLQRALDAHGRAADAAVRAGAPDVLAAARLGLARAHVALAQYERAEPHFVYAYAAGRRAHDPKAMARALSVRGETLLHRGRHAAAKSALEQMLAQAEGSGDQRLVAEALNNLGVVAYDRREYATAVHLLERARVEAEAAGDRVYAAEVVGNLGTVLQETGDLARAGAYQLEKAEMARAVGWLSGVAYAVGNLALVYADVGDYPPADAADLAAVRLAHSLGDRRAVSILINHLAYSASHQGRRQEALARFRAALRIGREIGLERYLCLYMRGMAEILAEDPGQGAAGEAEALVREGLAIAAATGQGGERARLEVVDWRLRVATGRASPAAAAQALLARAETAVDPARRLPYLVGAVRLGADGRARPALVETLYLLQGSGRAEVRNLQRELTGSAPPAPTLPLLPAWVAETAGPYLNKPDLVLSLG